MKLLLNIFLISFFINGGLSVVNELAVIFSDSAFFSDIRYLSAVAGILISIPVYLSSGINASVPKRVILPLIFFLIWASATAPPLPLFVNDKNLQLLLSVMQLLLSLATFGFIKQKSGSWMITNQLLPDFSFSIKNTLGFFATNLIILPVIAVVIILVSVQTFLSHKTAGFLRVSTNGIFMKEKVYKKETKLIRLIGMIHIGEEDYYKHLTDSMSDSGSILLAEGVSDKNNLLKNGFSTKGFSKMYGLSSQEDMSLDGRLISPAQLSSPDFSASGKKLTIMNADVDVKSFSQDTLDFLNMAGEYIFQEDSFATGMKQYNQWVRTNTSPELITNITFDILEKRNKRVISLIGPATERFNTVIVPWGAMHMPAIESAVQAKGFVIIKTDERQSMVFSSDLVKKLLSTIASHQ